MRYLAAVTFCAVQLSALPPASSQEALPTQSEEVARAEALLAEFRAARPDREGLSEAQWAKDGGKRRRLAIAPDMLKLDPAAAPLLLKALEDPDPEVSTVAAFALGRIGDPQAVETMLKALESFIPLSREWSPGRPPPPGNLRAAAYVCVLGRLREPRAVKPIVVLMWLHVPYSNLVEEFGVPEDLRDHYMCGGYWLVICKEAIRNIGSAAAPQLLELLSDGDHEVRNAAAGYLGDFGMDDREAKLKRLAEITNSPDASAKLREEGEALKQALESSDRVAALAGERLIQLLHDKDMDVSMSAVRALGRLHVTAAVRPLMEGVTEFFVDHDVVSEAINSLKQLCDPVAVDMVRPFLELYPPAKVDPVELASALESVPKAMALIKSELGSPALPHRHAAISGLWAPGTSEATDLLITALRDKHEGMRCKAAYCLGLLKGVQAARAVDPLIAATRDEGVGAREAAVSALSQIADPRGNDAILAALKDAGNRVRCVATWALGHIKDPRCVELAKGMLKDPDQQVRSSAVHALALLNPPDLSECVKPLLEDAAYCVRSAAQEALRQAAQPPTPQTKER